MTAARGGTVVLGTLLAALAAIAACKDTVPSSAVTDCDQQVIPGGAAVDMLFVVDDSNSMFQEQQELAANLNQFIDALANAPVRLDLRVGVTNTSVHDYSGETAYGALAWDGTGWVAFPGTPSTPYPDGTIVAIHQNLNGTVTAGNFEWNGSAWGGSRILATGPTLVGDFEANVLQGIWGAGKEQPLAAMKRALELAANGGVNSGFRRAGARLAVVVLTDEDDCSSGVGDVVDDVDCRDHPLKLTPLGDYVQFLASTAVAGGGVDPPLFALIAGFDAAGVATTCYGGTFSPPTSTQAFRAPTRLNEFVQLLDSGSPGRTLKRSICGSFGPSLLRLADMIIPQSITLAQTPEDYRLLTVALDRGGTLVSCPVALVGSAGPGTGAVYTPPGGGAPATLQFLGPCVLGIGDRIEIGIVCAR
jgi:hypothetical protein